MFNLGFATWFKFSYTNLLTLRDKRNKSYCKDTFDFLFTEKEQQNIS